MPTRVRKSTAARGYGSTHAEIRRRVARLVAIGRAVCARCGELIEPGSAWHLDHSDDRRGYLGPSHALCNQRAGGLKVGGRRRSRRW